MADNELRPIESDETYTYDLQLAERVARARTAASNYRARVNPSYFHPAPSAPSDDPDPPSESDDIRPGGSAKVDYYDGLYPTHRGKTGTEVTRFRGELTDYKTYYDVHIRKTGEPAYQIPDSQVQPLNVTPDGADRPNESNLVSDYDVAASGYSGISVNSTGTTGTRNGAYTQKMADAQAKFDKLQSETDPAGIVKQFKRLTDKFNSTYNSDRSGVTDRSQMSVIEAGKADITTSKSNIDNMKTTVMGNSSNPAANTVNWFKNDITSKVEQMVNNVKNGLISIEEYNALEADILSYVKQNKSYTRFKSERRSYYPAKFTEEILHNCWTRVYDDYHAST